MRKLTLLLLPTLMLSTMCPSAFGWGLEGHRIIAIIAKKNMTAAALKNASAILGGASLESVASWADDYQRSHPETEPWHFINIPLQSSSLDLARDCPNGNCVTAKAEEFLAVLKNTSASQSDRAFALKFLVHIIGDLHQPLHCEDNNDGGGNDRHVIFHGQAENLHSLWDSGLIEHINGNAAEYAADLESDINEEDKIAWGDGTIEEWAMEAHDIAQAMAYSQLGTKNPAVIGPSYENSMKPFIESQLRKAGIRLATLLNDSLR
jgi:hypothetical protein